MLKKSKRMNSSQTLKQFQSFVKRRLQKKNILESNHQSINNKILCFQQLLRLTKTGASITSTTHKDAYSTPQFIRGQEEKRKEEHAVEVEENAEMIACRLDKMVHDTNCWINSTRPDLRKYKHIEKNEENFLPLQSKKNKTNNQSLHKSKNNLTTEDKESIPYINKKKLHLSRGQSHKYLPSNRNTVSKTIQISTKIPDFLQLKNEILLYENKAKQKYGLSFQKPTKKDLFEDEQDLFLQKADDKEMIKFIETNEIKRQSANPYKKLVEQHTRQDSSIPSNLLGIIRSCSAKTRKMNTSTSVSRYIRI